MKKGCNVTTIWKRFVSLQHKLIYLVEYEVSEY